MCPSLIRDKIATELHKYLCNERLWVVGEALPLRKFFVRQKLSLKLPAKNFLQIFFKIFFEKFFSGKYLAYQSFLTAI